MPGTTVNAEESCRFVVARISSCEAPMVLFVIVIFELPRAVSVVIVLSLSQSIVAPNRSILVAPWFALSAMMVPPFMLMSAGPAVVFGPIVNLTVPGTFSVTYRFDRSDRTDWVYRSYWLGWTYRSDWTDWTIWFWYRRYE